MFGQIMPAIHIHINGPKFKRYVESTTFTQVPSRKPVE